MEQAGGDGDLVEPHLGEDHRDVERVDEVGLAGEAELVPVGMSRDDVGAAQERLVDLRVVALDLLEDVLEPQHAFIIAAAALAG